MLPPVQPRATLPDLTGRCIWASIVLAFHLGVLPKADCVTSDGSALIWPSQTGVLMDTWGYDVKQLNRLGELSESVASLVFQEHGFNLLRTPIRACYHPEWKSRYPYNAHPYPGKVNSAAYEGEVSDVVHAKAVKPDIKLFASLRLCLDEATHVFYPALPDWCLYNETDEKQGRWDGSKDTQVKAPMYAELLADFLTFFESAGIFYDFLGIENESGFIGNKTFVDVVAELKTLQKLRNFTLPLFVGPDNYAPPATWFHGLEALHGGALMHVAGTHYYSQQVFSTKKGRLHLQDDLTNFVASVPPNTPKWHTEVHWVKAKDIKPTDIIGRSANHIDELENVLAVQANLYDHGFSGFVWWSYGTKTAEFAPSTSTDFMRVAMHAITESTLMRVPVLMDDHDGKNASQYSFTTRALRRGDSIVVWVTNNNDVAWEAYPFILASGNLQAPCGVSDIGSIGMGARPSIRWDQYYLASTSTNRSGSQDPMWGNRSGVATVLGSNAFSVPIPKRTVTKITLDVTGVVDPTMHVARFHPHADLYVLEKGDAGVLDNVYKLNTQIHGWGGVALIKFHTEGLNGAVVNATLYVHVAEASGIEHIMVERVGNDWKAKNVKWSSLPARAPRGLSAVAGQPTIPASSWLALDVTSGLDNSNWQSFLLSTDTLKTYTTLHSTRSDYAPYLEVVALESYPEIHGACEPQNHLNLADSSAISVQ